MKTSIATISLSGTFREKLDAIATAGFDAFELLEQDFIASDLSPREVRAMVRDHGLSIALLHPFRDFEGLPEPHRSRALARARLKFDLMNALEVDLILFCSNMHPASLGGIDRMAADYHDLGEMAREHGVRVGFEALAWGRHVSDHRDAWEVVRRADHPNIGIILDSFHSLSRDIPSDSIRSIPADKIFLVQLADAPAIRMDLLHWSRHFRNMPGEGDFDITGFLAAVLATGYSGPLSLEIMNDEYRSTLPRIIAQDGHRSLLAALDRVRRTTTGLTVDLAPFPPPQKAECIEFIEFATSKDDVAGLAALLGQTGFSRAGQHVSKDVSLWRQGDANLLLNTDPDGFARFSFASHGTNVAEIGLRVQDADAAFRRAVALDARPWEQPVAPGELHIPAVRGVGGTLLRFVDMSGQLGKVWEVEFRSERPAAGVGITGVDHVGQTMAHDEMLSWALYYTSILDAAKAPIVDVVDPDGLVTSQAIESGGFRVTLNGSDARRTLAGRFVEETFGAAVQHIAFASDDLFATAAALQKTGFPALVIGASYYDDVRARFGLSTDFVARLRAANMLYDEDDTGIFLQLYSQSREDGFFIEICQRKGGYAGYGAPNAPFRIAAQKRLRQPAGMPKA